jgi:hypothetical protein
MSTHHTQSVNNTAVQPNLLIPSDGSQYQSYLLGMSYVLKVLMEVGARNDSIVNMDQQINAKKDLEEAILNGAQHHFNSAGEMASYFQFIAQHAASLGLSSDMTSWLQNQAQGMTDVLNDNMNQNLQNYIKSQSGFFAYTKNGLEYVNGVHGGTGTGYSKDFYEAFQKYANEYQAYITGVNAKNQASVNSSTVIEKTDEKQNLMRTSEDNTMNQLPENMQAIVAAVANVNS